MYKRKRAKSIFARFLGFLQKNIFYLALSKTRENERKREKKRDLLVTN